MAKILIVDDDPDIIEAATLFLQREGYSVVSAHNRQSGMAAVEREKPELLILDVMMEQPDDGIAMAQALRAQGNNLPILMLTSISSVTGYHFAPDAETIPVDDFQEKPVQPTVLAEKVKRLLQARESRSC
ncbi:MAG: hypothetical protein AMXMBFR84_20380 [Candidatus Hydrogenedentota bacterium]